MSNYKPFVYKGNKNLKQAGVPIEWTPELIEEYKKCANDIKYFIKKYIKIVHVDDGLIPFEMYDFQEDLVDLFDDNRFSLAMCPRQVGKLLRLEEDIPTPSGFRKMGDLRVGDQVFDEFGNPCNILHVSEVQEPNMYEITFDDGTSIECCEDHQWQVQDRFRPHFKTVKGKRQNYQHKTVVATTKELFETNWKRVNSRGYTEYAYYIPNTEPVNYPHKEVKIDPYMLGAWLGDGSSYGNQFTCHLDHAGFYVEQNIEMDLSKNYDKRDNNVYTSTIKNMSSTSLKEYNLLQTTPKIKTKHIPPEYLFNDINTRISVLQGLMDTDGFIEKNGLCCIQLTKKNQRLLEDVYTLLCSLGLKVTTSHFAKNDSTRFSFSVGRDKFDVCRIPHKLKRQKTALKNARYVYSRTIQDIKPLNKTAKGVCIQVDSPNSLYLCTNSYIPTHNSTIVCAYIIHYILFNKDKNVAILANKHSTAKEIMYKLQTSYEHLPCWLQQGVVGWNKTDIELENGSRVSAAATSGNSIRGSSYNLIFLDEFAHVDNNMAREFFASVYPTISSGKTTKIITVSTPRGMNHFHKLWIDAEKGRNAYKPYRVHWHDVPGRDQEWFDTECKNLEDWQVRQEILCQFIGSSNTLIDPVKLESLVYEPPISRKPGLNIYEHPEKDHYYICTVDTAEGLGGDYSVISVFDITQIPYKQVAVFRNNEISTIMLPSTIYSIASHYNNAHVLVELNFGSEVAVSLHYNLEYEHILHTMHQKFKNQELTEGFGGGRGNQLGVKMTKSVKRDGCSNLKALIEHDKLIINDHDTIEELHRFVSYRGSWAAENNDDHDDIVMSLVIFAWMTTQTVFKEISNTDVRKRIEQDKLYGMPEDIVPFGMAVQDGDIVLGGGKLHQNGKEYHRGEDGLLWENVEIDETFGWPINKRPDDDFN